VRTSLLLLAILPLPFLKLAQPLVVLFYLLSVQLILNLKK
jgi:hypothetical protein